MLLAPLLAAGIMAAASVQSTDGAHAAATSAAHIAPAVGAQAPDFTYQSYDYRWLELHDMLAQGSVLLVFAPSDAQLTALQRDREALLRDGVVPVAVEGRPEADVWRTVSRCDLEYSVLSDPRDTIASLFGTLDATRRPVPAWFVIAPSGRIRAAGRDLPASGSWLALARSALGVSDVATAGTSGRAR